MTVFLFASQKQKLIKMNSVKRNLPAKEMRQMWGKKKAAKIAQTKSDLFKILVLNIDINGSDTKQTNKTLNVKNFTFNSIQFNLKSHFTN